jgi:hypothetical protein
MFKDWGKRLSGTLLCGDGTIREEMREKWNVANAPKSYLPRGIKL